MKFLPRPKAAWFQFSLRSLMLFVVVVWKGTDPTPASAARGISKIPVKVDFETARVRVYLDSPNFPGWNEIDAVGLRYSWGRIIWADSATARRVALLVDCCVPLACLQAVLGRERVSHCR